MQEKEFGPLDDIHSSEDGMHARAGKRILVHALQCVDQFFAAFVEIPEQGIQRQFGVDTELRIVIRRVAGKSRRIAIQDPFETKQKNGLIAGEMNDVLEGAPFGGVYAVFELVFGEVCNEFANGPMLKFQPGPGG